MISLSIAILLAAQTPNHPPIDRPTNQTITTTPFVLDEFKVGLPVGVTASHQKSADFYVVTFKTAGRPILSVYIGNASQFQRSVKGHEREVISAVNGPVECQTYVSVKHGRKSRETLIRRSDAAMAAQFHAWYKGLGPHDSKLADDVIQSIQYDEAAVDRLKKLEASQSVEE